MKIGFLAMSGVRACDPELLALGLTLPGFVERSRVVAQLPSLGLLNLAAATPAGIELEYFEAEKDGVEPEAVYRCDLVAISTFSAQVGEAYAIADRLRAGGVQVAMGGLHVSVLPDEAALHVDHVIIGEGERVWPDVVRAAMRGERGKRWDAKEYGLVDVRTLPVPRYDLLPEHRYNRFTVQTSRGCPWRCEFCASNVMLGMKYRKRPVGDVVRDIEALRRLRPHPFIEFADDNTFVDKEWGRALCSALIPLRLKWFTETDISVGDDPELLAMMAESGCRQVLIGLESPERSALERMELNANFKAKRSDGAAVAIERIQRAGITVNGCFIVGLDTHGPEIFDRIYDFAMDVGLFEVQVTVLTPFPGTPLYSRLEREGRLLYPGAWERCTLFDINYVPKRMSVRELHTGLLDLVSRLYSAENMRLRRKRYFDHHRNVAPSYLPLAA